ncbi:MAG: histidine phosphatase family protein [Pseudomonadota bacterium]
MKLWLVRHAQPLIDSGICYGQLDMQADARATQDAATALSRILPRDLLAAHSPLQRCRQLADALIGIQPQMKFTPDVRLQEMHFGNWENRSWRSLPRTELDDWTADFANYTVGQNGESVSTFMTRVASVFDALPRNTDVLWVTHAGVIRAAQLLARGIRNINKADQWPSGGPSYGQWCTLEIQN